MKYYGPTYLIRLTQYTKELYKYKQLYKYKALCCQLYQKASRASLRARFRGLRVYKSVKMVQRYNQVTPLSLCFFTSLLHLCSEAEVLTSFLLFMNKNYILFPVVSCGCLSFPEPTNSNLFPKLLQDAVLSSNSSLSTLAGPIQPTVPLSLLQIT